MVGVLTNHLFLAIADSFVPLTAIEQLITAKKHEAFLRNAVTSLHFLSTYGMPRRGSDAAGLFPCPIGTACG
jgi:hypothetical protein